MRCRPLVAGLVLAALIAGVGRFEAQEPKKDTPPADAKKDPPADPKKDPTTPPDPKKDPAPAAKVRGQLPQNFKQLGLTDDQKQQVYKIQAEFGAKVDELKAQITKLQKDEKAAIDKVLTDAQRTRLQEILKDKAGVKDPSKPSDK